MQSKISIITANYNNANYIRESINSVLSQTSNRWELLIIDDCSTDNSAEVIKDFLDDIRIKFYRNKKNLGYTKTLKLMIEKSSAPIVGILDSDDKLDKNAIEEILKLYNLRPNVGMVYSQYYICDDKLNPKYFGYSGKIKPGETNLRLNVAHHFKTFRKEVYHKTSGYDEELKYAEDIDLNLKIEEVSKLYFIDKPLYYYRILPRSQTHGQINSYINRSSTALAKLKAYKRRINTDISNLSRAEIAEVLFFGIINALLARRFKLLLKFKINLFLIYPIFFLDLRFYYLVFKKISKILCLKNKKLIQKA